MPQGAPPPPPQAAPVEHTREPCPDRILDDMGGAFAMGAVGGGAWHLVKGLRNSPSGFRVRGALESLRKEAPRLGGSFANWGLAFSCFDCSLQAIRKKEDPWNAIAAGALTGGFLQLRFGLKSAAKSAAFGGILLALIEGLGITLNKMTSPPPPGVPFQPPPGAGGPPPPAPEAAGSSAPPPPPDFASSTSTSGSSSSGGGGGGWFGSLWGSSSGGSGSGSSSSSSTSGSGTTFSEETFAPPPMPEEFKTDPGFRS